MKSFLSAPSQVTLQREWHDSNHSDQHQGAEAALSAGLVIAEGQVTAEAATGKTCESLQQRKNGPLWKVFTSTFITIFLAELGDKTQVSTLLMTAEFHNPWVVFAGAASALITTSLLGVLVGRWLSTRLSAKTLDTAAGITLALISVFLLCDVVQM